MATENVEAWSTTAATNASADTGINWAEGQDPATVNNSARGMMAAIAKQSDDQGGALAAGGTANALTVTTGQVLASGQVTAGLRLLLRATADNTNATVTFAPDGLTAANIKRADGSALAVGSIKSGMYLDLVYNSGSSEWRCANIAPQASATPVNSGLTGQLFGLTLSNDSGGTTAIAVAAGSARDSTDVDTLVVSSAITAKTLGTAWAVGSSAGLLDTGAVANTTYHIYLIKRLDTGVVDVIASTSASAPTLPANYTLYRRIGSIVRAGAAIKAFKQDGDRFRWLVGVQDVSVLNPGTSAVTRTLTVPAGIVAWADIIAIVSPGGATVNYGLITALDETDTNPATTPTPNFAGVGANAYYPTPLSIKTNTSAQVRSRISPSASGDTLQIYTWGWVDTRGRLA